MTFRDIWEVRCYESPHHNVIIVTYTDGLCRSYTEETVPVCVTRWMEAIKPREKVLGGLIERVYL